MCARACMRMHACMLACMYACIRRIHAHIHEHACLPIWPIHAFTNILTSRSSSWPMARPVCLNECVCVYMCTHACEFVADAVAFGFHECTAVCLCTYDFCTCTFVHTHLYVLQVQQLADGQDCLASAHHVFTHNVPAAHAHGGSMSGN